MKKKGVLSIMMAVAMAANLAGCGSSGTDAGSGEPTKTAEVSSEKEETSSGAEKAVSTEAKSDKVVSDITIAYVPTTMNNPFWTAMMGGIKDAMTDKGMDPGRQLVTVDAESDQATMNNYIYDLINQEVDAIIMAPMDCTACTEALQACADANIPVVNVDTAADRTDLVVSVIASDNYAAGVECAKNMMEKLEEGSKIYIMNQPSGTACVQREQGFRDTIGDYFNQKEGLIPRSLLRNKLFQDMEEVIY